MSSVRSIKAIIFDFDGLLMDTETTLLECWRYAWRQYGLELDPTTFFADHGADVSAERQRELAEAVGPTFDPEFSRTRRLAYRAELHARLGLREGIEDWLAEARDSGLRCAVASSSPRSWVTGLLTGVDRLEAFTTLAFGDEVPEHKPAPDVYLLALDRLGLDPSEAVAVEDSPHGVAAAKAAGLACIAIPHPHVDPARFPHADLLLRSAADLPLSAALARLARLARR